MTPTKHCLYQMGRWAGKPPALARMSRNLLGRRLMCIIPIAKEVAHFSFWFLMPFVLAFLIYVLAVWLFLPAAKQAVSGDQMNRIAAWYVFSLSRSRRGPKRNIGG